MNPSCSSSCSSARSICFRLDNSRTAAKISAEPTIKDLSRFCLRRTHRRRPIPYRASDESDPESQPCLLHVRERHPPRLALLGLEDHHLVSGFPFDRHHFRLESPAVLRAENV